MAGSVAGGYRILIVPDSLLELEVGPSLLDRDGYRVRTARGGAEALSMCAVWTPDLVLFGMRLPDMTAEKLVAGLRAQGGGLRLCAIMDQVGAGNELAGVDGRLVEPVSPAQLAATLAALLDVRVRSAPRVGVQLLAYLADVFEDGGASGYGNLLTLSQRGGLIEAPRQLRPGAQGRIRFALPGGGSHLEMDVVVNAMVDEIQLHYAIVFAGISAGQREQIATFVDRRRGTGPGAEPRDKDGDEDDGDDDWN